MFAVTAFCIATFAILALVSQTIASARRLQRPLIDAGLVAAELSITNKLVEGTYDGDLSALLGQDYRGYTWTEDVTEEQTNKLFHVDVAIQRNEDHSVVSSERYLFYRPDSPAGTLDGATGAR
ncbi:MAG TPA: hypothetical protein VN625_10960 [Desulfuromonadaceae bacterium]|nr:hypothetical protein [Desulfuromonadaceae bacterium]